MNNYSQLDKTVFTDIKDLENTAITLILDSAEAAIKTKGKFVLGLAGGTTPVNIYKKLANMNIDLSNWYFIYGDERNLPLGDPERNASIIHTAWLDQANLLPEQDLVIPYDPEPELAAKKYASLIQDLLPLDLALLGMGEDGHTASLFPGHQHEKEISVVYTRQSPKPPADRVSLNYAVFNAANSVCFIVTGKNKQDAMRQWKQGQDLPIANIIAQEKTLLFIDQEADKE